MVNDTSKTMVEDLVISGVPVKTKKAVMNIAKNLGIDASAFMKTKLREILAQYPDKMHEPPMA